MQMMLFSLLLASSLVLVTSTARAESGFVVGVGVHLVSPDAPADRTLRTAHEAGIESFRDDAPWAIVEKVRGQYQIPAAWDHKVDLARSLGMTPLLILDYGNPLYDGGAKPTSPEAVLAFAKYAQFVATHFKGRVQRYEIWNEWDNSDPSGLNTAQNYIDLISAVYPLIKAADPQAQVLAGAVTSAGVRASDGLLTQIVRAGLRNRADGVSIHPYIHCARQRTPEDWALWMAQVGDALKQIAGREVPVYITEMSWPTSEGSCGIPEGQQAQYLARLYLLARSMPFIKGIWWYDFRNDGIDPANREHNFGLVKNDFAPKPALAAMKGVAPLAARGRFLGQVVNATAGGRALSFKDADGSFVFASWAETSGAAVLKVKSKLPRPPLSVSTVGANTQQPLPCECATGATSSTSGCQGAQPLSEMPVLVRTILQNDLSVAVEAP